MLQVHQHQSLEEASSELLDFILQPKNWVMLTQLKQDPARRPGQNPDYQRQVGNLGICASVDVTADLSAFLRIAFKAPNLTPTKAADHLTAFLGDRIPMVPNSEWQVQVDPKNWIHFIRRYSGAALSA